MLSWVRQPEQPAVGSAGGLLFGSAVWLIADEIGVPLAGFASNPTDYPISRQASALASHLIYGLTVEGERRVLPGQADAA
jgi:putative membrane protein